MELALRTAEDNWSPRTFPEARTSICNPDEEWDSKLFATRKITTMSLPSGGLTRKTRRMSPAQNRLGIPIRQTGNAATKQAREANRSARRMSVEPTRLTISGEIADMTDFDRLLSFPDNLLPTPMTAFAAGP